MYSLLDRHNIYLIAYQTTPPWKSGSLICANSIFTFFKIIWGFVVCVRVLDIGGRRRMGCIYFGKVCQLTHADEGHSYFVTHPLAGREGKKSAALWFLPYATLHLWKIRRMVKKLRKSPGCQASGLMAFLCLLQSTFWSQHLNQYLKKFKLSPPIPIKNLKKRQDKTYRKNSFQS